MKIWRVASRPRTTPGGSVPKFIWMVSLVSGIASWTIWQVMLRVVSVAAKTTGAPVHMWSSAVPPPRYEKVMGMESGRCGAALSTTGTTTSAPSANS